MPWIKDYNPEDRNEVKPIRGLMEYCTMLDDYQNAYDNIVIDEEDFQEVQISAEQITILPSED